MAGHAGQNPPSIGELIDAAPSAMLPSPHAEAGTWLGDRCHEQEPRRFVSVIRVANHALLKLLFSLAFLAMPLAPIRPRDVDWLVIVVRKYENQRRASLDVKSTSFLKRDDAPSQRCSRSRCSQALQSFAL